MFIRCPGKFTSAAIFHLRAETRRVKKVVILSFIHSVALDPVTNTDTLAEEDPEDEANDFFSPNLNSRSVFSSSSLTSVSSEAS